MKKRKLSSKQAQSLLSKIVSFFDIHYNDTGADAYTRVDGRTYCLVYDQNIKFTGVAYRLS